MYLFLLKDHDEYPNGLSSFVVDISTSFYSWSISVVKDLVTFTGTIHSNMYFSYDTGF